MNNHLDSRLDNDFICLPDAERPALLKSALLSESGAVRHGFSTRLGGVSAEPYYSLNLGLHTADTDENVRENYKRFCALAGVSFDRLVLTRQVHSANIRVVSGEDAGKGLTRPSDLGETDGLITAERGLPIGVFCADCTPVLLLDPVRRVIAAVHSGWKGTCRKISAKAVRMMCERFGCRPPDILAATGPSIKQCHFEVGEEVFEQFCDSFGEEQTRRATCEKSEKNGKFYIDTDRLNRELLLAEGLRVEHISQCTECTYCRHDIFYSHRADGGATGRMCAVIELV